MSQRTIARAAILLPMIGTVIARPAAATPLLGTFGSPSGPNPFNARVLPSGADAAWFNPGLLLDVDPRIEAGVFAIRQSFDIALRARPDGADIAPSIYDARAVNPDGSTRRLAYRPLPTASLRTPRGSVDPSQTGLYLTIGTVVHVIPDRFAIGMHTLLPTRSFQTQRSAFADEREQYFSNSLHYELYGDRLETNLISLAAAVRPFDGLTVGLGATASNEGRATNQAFVPDASDQSVIVVNTSVEVHTRFRPYMGVDVDPFQPLHVVATLHLPYSNDTVGTNDLQLWNYEYPPGQTSFLQGFDYVSHASPLTAALGAGWRPKPRGTIGFEAAATVVWAQWSHYRDRHHAVPEDPWLDTFSASLGGSARWHDHRLGLDAAYQPSPVPRQSGRSNYVDSDRLGAAAGYAGRFHLGSTRFEAGAQLQIHRLLPRSETKSWSAAHPVIDEFPDAVDARTGQPIEASHGLQTNNPGYPGYDTQGWLLAAGVSLAVLL
jgi:long-chain fatty acid transport protein